MTSEGAPAPAQSRWRTRLGSGLGAPYWRVWSAHAISNLGDGIGFVALPLVAVSITTDARLVALVPAAHAAPLMVVGPFAGVLADRVDRRSLMAWIDLMRAAVVVVLAVLLATDGLSIWTLIVASAVLGTAEVPFDISTPAMVRNVVATEQLELANARVHSVQLVNNEFLGGPIGGVMFAATSWLPLAAMGSMFVGASGTLTTVPGSFKAERTEARSVRSELLDGHRFVWAHPILRPQALSVAALAFAEGTTTAVLVLYATQVLGLGPVGFGLIGTIVGVAALVASLVVPRFVARVGHGTSMAIGVVIMGAGFVIVGLTDQVWLALVGFSMEAAGAPMWNVVSATVRQRLVPDQVFGKVSAAYLQIGRGTVAAGAVFGGFIAQQYGSGRVYLLTGVISAVVLVAGRRFFSDVTSTLAPSPAPESD